MFLCNTQTERDCLGRMLFGSPASKWHEVSTITKRTAIFLYTLGRFPMVRGIFVAQKPPFFDRSGPYKGKFPSQVSVRWYCHCNPIPSGMFKFSRLFGGDGNRERKLSKSQTQLMIAVFFEHISKAKSLVELQLQQGAKTITKATKQKKAGKNRVAKSRSSYFSYTNVLLFDGRPIPVYNPRGVDPVTRALPPILTRSQPRHIPTVGYFPNQKMILYPGLGFQPTPIQAQVRAVAGRSHFRYPGSR